MILAMSRPWKHPKSGVYWLRKRVPDDLQTLVGKREEKRSLQTRDPVEAKRRHAEALAEIESRWANLRAGPRVLTEVEAHQMAAAVHDQWLQQHRDNPSGQTYWQVNLGEHLFAPPEVLTVDKLQGGKFLTDFDPIAFKVLEMEKWCQGAADERLAAHGLVVDDRSRRKLGVAIGAAVQRASVALARLAKGEMLPSAVLFPVQSKSVALADTRPVPFQFLVDGWSTERRPVAKTVYEWSRVVRQLKEFLGHDDAKQLTGESPGVESLAEWTPLQSGIVLFARRRMAGNPGGLG